MDDVTNLVTKSWRGLYKSVTRLIDYLVKYCRKTCIRYKRWLTSRVASIKGRLRVGNDDDPTLF